MIGRAVLFGLVLATTPTLAAEFYGGHWALRCDSDAKLSFSWIAAWTGDREAWRPFVEPMLGLSASGIYAGVWREVAPPAHRGSRRRTILRPKLGLIRTYHDPWFTEDDAWYGYAGAELGVSDWILGLNLQAGILVGTDGAVPSLGLGFGF